MDKITLLQIDQFEMENLRKPSYAPDSCVVSFPRSGRTWLKYMMYYIQLRLGLTEYSNLTTFKHDNIIIQRPIRLRDYSPKKYKYRDRRVVLLVRDPRDVLVSAYHWVKFNRKSAWIRPLSISKFIRCDYGLKLLLQFMNDWAAQRGVPKEFMLIRYAELVNDCHETLRRVLKFILPDLEISTALLDEAIEACSFDSLQEHCRSVKSDGASFRLLGTSISGDRGLLARRGVIGGYVDSLTKEDIDWVDAKIKKQLDPFYACYIRGAQQFTGAGK